MTNGPSEDLGEATRRGSIAGDGKPLLSSTNAHQLHVKNVPMETSGPAGFNMKFKLFEACGEACASAGKIPGTGRVYWKVLASANASNPILKGLPAGRSSICCPSM